MIDTSSSHPSLQPPVIFWLFVMRTQIYHWLGYYWRLSQVCSGGLLVVINICSSLIFIYLGLWNRLFEQDLSTFQQSIWFRLVSLSCISALTQPDNNRPLSISSFELIPIPRSLIHPSQSEESTATDHNVTLQRWSSSTCALFLKTYSISCKHSLLSVLASLSKHVNSTPVMINQAHF